MFSALNSFSLVLLWVLVSSFTIVTTFLSTVIVWMKLGMVTIWPHIYFSNCHHDRVAATANATIPAGFLLPKLAKHLSGHLLERLLEEVEETLLKSSLKKKVAPCLLLTLCLSQGYQNSYLSMTARKSILASVLNRPEKQLLKVGCTLLCTSGTVASNDSCSFPAMTNLLRPYLSFEICSSQPQQRWGRIHTHRMVCQPRK